MQATHWLKKIIAHLPRKRSTSAHAIAQHVKGKDYQLNDHLVSFNALKTLKRLHDMKHEAYIVGGSVRDMLVGKIPKDFDIATDARPEQMRKIFRNCRLIGRRFRLVHIYFSDEIIEVATFRASDSDNKNNEHTDAEGMILHDNIYGTLAEDALRRDFTINALYYDPITDTITDFVNGLHDITHKTIRLIGDPSTRYREDPVRILRAIRFAAKLDFFIETNAALGIKKIKHLISNVASSRLFEEVLKLFFSAHAYNTYQQLEQHDLLTILFPPLKELTAENLVKFSRLFTVACQNTDDRLARGKNINPGFLFAVLLWLPLQEQLDKNYDAAKIPPVLPSVLLDQSIQAVLQNQLSILAIPRRFTQVMREIWELQSRLVRRHPRMIDRLLEHPRFRAAYDFLVLRTIIDGDVQEAADWWTTLQDAAAADRHNMIAQLKTPTKRRRKSK
ncbi:MAG: polynucleotide adenylyltransferase PcnB [Gammaproteobacteria bacterium]|nr:polynucleotide adenylyltransferase PcnB [Gammaproteobacteria bacterium]